MSLRGVMRRPDPAYARPFDPTSAAPARPCDNPIQHGSQWLSRSQRLPHPIIVRHQPPPCHSDEISGNLTRIARQGVVDSRPVVVVSFSSVQRGEIDAARYRKGIAGWSPGGRRGQTRYGHQGPDQRRLRKPWLPERALACARRLVRRGRQLARQGHVRAAREDQLLSRVESTVGAPIWNPNKGRGISIC
jgi:hypothetical protein